MKSSWARLRFNFFRISKLLFSTPRDLALLYYLSRRKSRNLNADKRALGVDANWVYINLDRRTDRRAQIEFELKRMSLRSRRFSAVENEVRLLGCNLSHIEILRFASRRDEPALVIEDDVEFLCNPRELRYHIEEFYTRADLDVLHLCPTLYGPAWPISRRLSIANSIRSGAAYIAKPTALPLLIDSFEQSARMLIEGFPRRKASFDQRWGSLQKSQLLFAVPRKKIARQRKSFSDIEGQVVDLG